MQAFKLYFKIFKKGAMTAILIYVVIFLALTIVFSQVSQKQTTSAFETTKCNVAVINYDDSELSNELSSYLKSNSKPVDIKDDEESLKDALFFRKADFITIIPKGFGNDFLSGKANTIETMQIPDSMTAMFVSKMVDNYLNTANIYLGGTGEIDYNLVKKDLAISTQVNMSSKKVNDKMSGLNAYFNALVYPFLGILIMGVSMVMLIVNEENMKKRNFASPINQTKFSLQMLSGNFILSFCVFVLFIGLAIITFGKEMLSVKGAIITLNTFIFSLVALSLSFLISNVASKNAVAPISNFVSLGFCFLGGSFVPQSILGQTAKNTAIVNPAFWFVKANDTIDKLSTFNFETLNPALTSMAIELAFACAFAAISLVVIKSKRRSK